MWSLNPSDFVQAGVFWLGVMDVWDLYHIKRLTREGDTIFDVGANFGYYGLTLAKHLRGQCQIHCLEPNPSSFYRLTKNIGLNCMNSVVHAYPMGFSDTSQDAYLVERADNSGAARVSFEETDNKISLTTWDAFCVQMQIDQVQFAKIDVEGFEYRALKGGEEMLLESKPALLIEINRAFLGYAGSSPEKLIPLLRGYGYDLFIPKRGNLRPLGNQVAAISLENLIAIHPANERSKTVNAGEY
jgi:FkbM family methyltransferase